MVTMMKFLQGRAPSGQICRQMGHGRASDGVHRLHDYELGDGQTSIPSVPALSVHLGLAFRAYDRPSGGLLTTKISESSNIMSNVLGKGLSFNGFSSIIIPWSMWLKIGLQRPLHAG